MTTVSRKLTVPDWSEQNTAAILQDCLDVAAEDMTEVMLLVACSHTLLSRKDINESQKSHALLNYNQAMTLIVPPLLEAQGEIHLAGVKISLSSTILESERIFLNAKMMTLDERLAFKTFGELGVPGVIVRQNTQSSLDLFYPQEGVFRPITFTLASFTETASGWHFVIDAQQLNGPRMAVVGEQRYPLSYSPAAAFMMLLDQANIDGLSWTGLVSPTDVESRSGIFAVEEISRQKTPILMIHGLNSDPLIWRHLTLAILNDHRLHERYQIWHAFYPSGPPPFFTAMMLREKLAQLLGHLPAVQQQETFVVVGHSMGGIIAHTMVTDSGYELWDVIFKERPERLIKDGQEQKIKDMFVFSPMFVNNTVFFINTPHGGSSTANSFIGQIGAALVVLPESFVGLIGKFISKVGTKGITPEMQPLLEDYGPNSVEVLRPGNPVLEKINTLPIKATVYSIIGSQDKTYCESPYACADVSDGVVPYSSAHIEQAAEEIVVQSDHDSYQNEDAINFILKTLKQR